MQIDINAWVSVFMVQIELIKYYNDDLFELFNEEFVKFDVAQFKRHGDIVLRELKKFLFERGVYIRKCNVTHAKALSEIMENDTNAWPIDTNNPSAHIESFKANNF